MPYPDLVPDFALNEIKRRINEDHPNVLDNPVGESIADRSTATTTGVSVTQQLRLVGFTAKATQNIGQVRVFTGGTAAGATPTLCRIGVWQRDSATATSYTQVAAIANDTALFAATNATYTRSFTTPFLKVMGTDYLVGILIVSAAAFPNFIGPNTVAGTPSFYTDAALAFPQSGGLVTGQADLPTTILNASIVANNSNFHALLLQ